MHAWFRLRQGLTQQVFVFVILPLTTALVAVALGSQWVHQQAMRAMVAERDVRAIDLAAAALSERVAVQRRLIEGLASALADPDAPQLSAYAALAGDFDRGLAVVASDSQVLDTSNGPTAWTSRPLPALLADWPDGSSTYLSPSFQDPTGAPSVVLAARIDAARRLVGAMSPESLLRRSLALTDSPAMALSWVLVDANGQVLLKTGPLLSEAPLLEHPGVADALRGERGTRFIPGADGQEHVVAFAPVPFTPWALLTEEPWDQVEGPVLRGTLMAPLILIPAIVLALVVLGFGLRQIVQPLRTLERQAADLGQGDFAAIDQPVGGIAEIQRLQAELSRMANKVRQAQAALRGYLGAMTAGQEEERRRLARELHDDTVQSLIALDQRAQLAQHAAAQASPLTRTRLADVRAMTSDLIENIRRVIRAMRPIYLEDLGLLPAIEMLARDVEAAGAVPVGFSVSGPVRRLPAPQEIGLYRIVQEALSNASRHARAHSITVPVTFTEHDLLIRVSDDGQGFTPPDRLSALSQDGHFGLMGMHERAELIGAQLQIHSSPGQGTTIELRLSL